jgi:hypothetical protein
MLANYGRIDSQSVLYRYFIAMVLLALFFWVMMKWEPAHFLLRNFRPIGRYVFLASFLITALSIYKSWCETTSGRCASFYSRFFEKQRPLTVLTVVMMLSLLPLFVSWSGDDLNYSMIGGLLPWSDANGYFFGAEHLLHEGWLDDWNQRRPLNATFFAARLVVTGFHFVNSILFQAALFGLSAFFAVQAVARTHGRCAAIIMFAVIYTFAAVYLPSTLSESFGLILGLLAFSLLWAGISELCLSLYVAGLWLLTLALLARAGAMLVLPAFVVFAAYLFRRKGFMGAYAILSALMAIGLGLLVNKSLLVIYGDGSGAALSNFSLVLYGLASGGKGWMQIYSDFPQVQTMSEAAASAFIYNKTSILVQNEPMLLLKVLLKNMFSNPLDYFYELIWGLFQPTRFDGVFSDRNITMGAKIALPVLILGGLKFVKEKFESTENKHSIFLLFFLIGFILSLPFIYQDGRTRVTAATFPFVGVIVALSVLGLHKNSVEIVNPSTMLNRQDVIRWMPAITGVVIILAAIILPIIGHKGMNKGPLPKGLCQKNEQELIMRSGTGTAFLNISDNEMRPSFVPELRKKSFRIPFTNQQAKDWRSIPLPATLLSGYDIISKQQQYVAGPLGFVERHKGYQGMCARNIGNQRYPIWKVEGLY